MRNVLLFALGGTIACVPTKRGLVPRLTATGLISAIQVPSGISVTGIDFLQRTIVFPQDWTALAKKIALEYDRYDGFVVTLGTDTLAYAAAALSLALKNLGKPVVLTGAMRPPHHPQTDAKRNLRDALRVASEKNIGGVLVVFDRSVIRGEAVSKVRSDSVNAFESIGEKPIGFVEREKIIWRKKPRAARNRLRAEPYFETQVANITLMPQAKPACLRYSSLKKYRGILVEGYGDGNVPSTLVPELQKLARTRILVLASQCAYGGVHHRYEGGAALLKAGALSAGTMTKEMALAKLMWALGQAKRNSRAKEIFGAVP